MAKYSDDIDIVTDAPIALRDGLWRLAIFIEEGGEQSLKYTYTIRTEDAEAGCVKNTARAFAEYLTDPTRYVYCDEVTVEVPVGRLVVEKTANPTTAKQGDEVTYTVKVTNNGGNDLTGVKVTDELLKAEFASAPSQGSVADGVWTIGDLANGKTATLTYTYTVTAEDANAGIIENTAIATGKNPAGYDITDEDSATVTVSSPALKITKAASVSTIDPGKNFEYTLIVENTGNETLNSVEVTDVLDEKLVYRGYTGNVGSVSKSGGTYGGTITWNIGELPANTSYTLQIRSDHLHLSVRSVDKSNGTDVQGQPEAREKCRWASSC